MVSFRAGRQASAMSSLWKNAPAIGSFSWLRSVSNVLRAFSFSQSHQRTPPPTTSICGKSFSAFSKPSRRPCVAHLVYVDQQCVHRDDRDVPLFEFFHGRGKRIDLHRLKAAEVPVVVDQ